MQITQHAIMNSVELSHELIQTTILTDHTYMLVMLTRSIIIYVEVFIHQLGVWLRLVAPYIIHRPEEEINMISESIFACTMVIFVPFRLFPTPIYHSKNVSFLVLVLSSGNFTPSGKK